MLGFCQLLFQLCIPKQDGFGWVGLGTALQLSRETETEPIGDTASNRRQ